jgi:trk system potassium uptake protein
MKIIVIGCGRLGAGIAESLSRHGDSVSVIDSDETAFERLSPAFGGETVTGGAVDREVLRKAGIEDADALAAVTSSDEVNVVAARLARVVFHVPRVAARLYDPRKAEIYQRLGLLTICPVSWGVSRITELLGYSTMEPVKSLGTGEVDILEIELPHLLAGRTVHDLTVHGEIHVVALTRLGKTFLPALGTELQQGDLVHLAVHASSGQRLKLLLGLE